MSTAAPVSPGHWMAALPGAKTFSQSAHVELLGRSFVQVDWMGDIPKLRAGNVVRAHVPLCSGSWPLDSGHLISS
jgi:hypothetical protein